MGYATEEQAQALLDAFEKQRLFRLDEMPTDQDALRVLFSAWQRFKELGWREIIYCPKDGSLFHAIEAGSTGIHLCRYCGEWPKGSWWILADGDMSPSHPILWRPIP